MSKGNWSIDDISMVSGSIPIPSVGIDAGLTTLKMTVSDPSGKTKSIFRRGATVSVGKLPPPFGDMQNSLMKKMGLTAVEGKGRFVEKTVKALAGNLNGGNFADLLSYFGQTDSTTNGRIIPNAARVSKSIFEKTAKDLTSGLVSAAFDLAKGDPAPPLTFESLSELHMQSIVLSGGAGPLGMDTGLFYFGIPSNAFGMPYAPWFSSAVGLFAYQGVTLKFPSAQLGVTFWSSGAIAN